MKEHYQEEIKELELNHDFSWNNKSQSYDDDWYNCVSRSKNGTYIEVEADYDKKFFNVEVRIPTHFGIKKRSKKLEKLEEILDYIKLTNVEKIKIFLMRLNITFVLPFLLLYNVLFFRNDAVDAIKRKVFFKNIIKHFSYFYNNIYAMEEILILVWIFNVFIFGLFVGVLY